MKDSPRNLQREFIRNIERLGSTVNENTFIDSNLQTDIWKRIIKFKDEKDKAKLFLLEKEEGLMKEIELVYTLIEEVRLKIDHLLRFK